MVLHDAVKASHTDTDTNQQRYCVTILSLSITFPFCRSFSSPREVEALQGHRTTRVSCGVWHTAAIVDIMDTRSLSPWSGQEPAAGAGASGEGASGGVGLKPGLVDVVARFSAGALFTWGDGEKYRLGHGDKKTRLRPKPVEALKHEVLCQVRSACM